MEEKVERRGRKSNEHEIVHRHIRPRPVFDDAIEKKRLEMKEEKVRRTRNPRAEVKYTDVVEWMAEKTLASENPKLAEFVTLTKKLKRLEG